MALNSASLTWARVGILLRTSHRDVCCSDKARVAYGAQNITLRVVKAPGLHFLLGFTL